MLQPPVLLPLLVQSHCWQQQHQTRQELRHCSPHLLLVRCRRHCWLRCSHQTECQRRVHCCRQRGTSHWLHHCWNLQTSTQTQAHCCSCQRLALCCC
jgi:hypothetical protein